MLPAPTKLLAFLISSALLLAACSKPPVPPAGSRKNSVDFRIAVQPSEVTGLAAADSLAKNGPDAPVHVNNAPTLWFEIHPMKVEYLTQGNFVTAKRDGKSYMLCYDDHARTLTHADPQRQPWSIYAGNPYTDSSGATVLPFNLNSAGANYMGQLSSDNMGHPMAILLDQKVLSAPTIHGHITDFGSITFGTPTPTRSAADIRQDAQLIQSLINAPRPPDSQPAR